MPRPEDDDTELPHGGRPRWSSPSGRQRPPAPPLATDPLDAPTTAGAVVGWVGWILLAAAVVLGLEAGERLLFGAPRVFVRHADGGCELWWQRRPVKGALIRCPDEGEGGR